MFSFIRISPLNGSLQKIIVVFVRLLLMRIYTTMISRIYNNKKKPGDSPVDGSPGIIDFMDLRDSLGLINKTGILLCYFFYDITTDPSYIRIFCIDELLTRINGVYFFYQFIQPDSTC